MLPFQATARLPIFIALLLIAMGLFIGGWRLHGAIHFFGFAVLSEAIYWGFFLPYFDNQLLKIRTRYIYRSEALDRDRAILEAEGELAMWRHFLRFVALGLVVFGALVLINAKYAG